jgi:hypothetical protein
MSVSVPPSSRSSFCSETGGRTPLAGLRPAVGPRRKLIEAADLVTEMLEVKYYYTVYTVGVTARDGIER